MHAEQSIMVILDGNRRAEAMPFDFPDHSEINPEDPGASFKSWTA